MTELGAPWTCRDTIRLTMRRRCGRRGIGRHTGSILHECRAFFVLWRPLRDKNVDLLRPMTTRATTKSVRLFCLCTSNQCGFMLRYMGVSFGKRRGNKSELGKILFLIRMCSNTF